MIYDESYLIGCERQAVQIGAEWGNDSRPDAAAKRDRHFIARVCRFWSLLASAFINDEIVEFRKLMCRCRS